jgi:sugar phosphate isomerase/epimerase
VQSLTLAHLSLSTTPVQTIDAAAQAGFGAVGLRICARRPGEPFASPILGDASAARALCQRAADRGIRLSNVSAYQFYPDVTWEHVAPVIDTTHLLGIPMVVVNCFDTDESRFIALFSRYCAAANAAGMRVALEFLPYSAVRTLEECLQVLERCGAVNAGVLLDSLHLDRSGSSPADIAAIPPEKIAFAQLCDAVKLTGPRTDTELLQEARTARLPAGEGELPLFDFLDALPMGLEIEYEVARLDMANRPAHEKAQAAHEDARRFMDRYTKYRLRTAAAPEA